MKKLGLLAILITLFGLSGCNQNLANQNQLDWYELMKPRWLAQGADPIETQTLYNQLKSTSYANWVMEWVELAEAYVKKAENALEKKELDQVFQFYDRAGLYYRIASFPSLENEPARAAYALSEKYYEQSFKFTPQFPQVISIPFENNWIKGYLRLSGRSQKQPLLIIIPGIESVKEDFLPYLASFAQQGYAVLVIDCPGTGSSPIRFRSDSERIINQIALFFTDHPQVNGRDITLIGFNFGAHLAYRSLNRQKGIRKMIGVGMPVTQIFQQNTWNRLPQSFQRNFLYFTGYKQFVDFYRDSKSFDLSSAANESTQISLIYGNQDLLAPAEEILKIAEKSKRPIQFQSLSPGYSAWGEQFSKELIPLVIHMLKPESCD